MAETLDKAESVTFRLESRLKNRLMDIAKRDRKSLGELLREIAREKVGREQRLAFEKEAQRQSLEAAAAARDSHSDEHAILRELDDDLEEFPNEWK